jgi:hypothetical protein
MPAAAAAAAWGAASAAVASPSMRRAKPGLPNLFLDRYVPTPHTETVHFWRTL